MTTIIMMISSPAHTFAPLLQPGTHERRSVHFAAFHLLLPPLIQPAWRSRCSLPVPYSGVGAGNALTERYILTRGLFLDACMQPFLVSILLVKHAAVLSSILFVC